MLVGLVFYRFWVGISLLDGNEFGITTSMFRGCSKSVVEVLAVVGGVVVGEARSENI